jgi:hypothetical protein
MNTQAGIQLHLTTDEAEALRDFIQYGLDSGEFDHLKPEEEATKQRIINILGMLKGGN